MASLLEAFCNITTDLQNIEPAIDNYDRKRILTPNWQASGTSNLYYLYNSGFVNVLFKDGKDLGAEQGSEPSSDDQWRYVEADDRLEFYLASSSTTALNGAVFEGGQDFDTLKQKIVNEQSDRIRSFINRPIFKRKRSAYQGASETSYDWVLVHSNAALACAALIRPMDPEKANAIEQRIISPDGEGLLDKTKRGEYALWHETTAEKNEGRVRDISVNASTTGGIVDTKSYAPPTVDWDDIRIVISTAGTFAAGTSSPVKFDSYVKSDEGIRMTKVMENETLNGSYQAIGHGLYGRFDEGVYTLNDEWGIIVTGGADENAEVKSAQLLRR